MLFCVKSRKTTRGGRVFLAVCTLLLFSCMGGSRDKAYKITQLAYTDYWGVNWNKVIELTTEAIKADSSFPWPYSMRGATYNVLGKYDLALKDLNKAIELKPDFSSAYTNRAMTYISMKEYDKAEKDLEKALEYHPFDVISLVRMAEVKSLKENEEEACQFMEEAIRSGFTELDIIEENANFEYILYSKCLKDLEELLQTLRKQSPPPRY